MLRMVSRADQEVQPKLACSVHGLRPSTFQGEVAIFAFAHDQAAPTMPYICRVSCYITPGYKCDKELSINIYTPDMIIICVSVHIHSLAIWHTGILIRLTRTNVRTGFNGKVLQVDVV